MEVTYPVTENAFSAEVASPKAQSGSCPKVTDRYLPSATRSTKAEAFSNLMLIAAHAQLLPIFEQDEVITVEPRMNFLHITQVHDGGPMNPNKVLRTEALHQCGQRLSNSILTRRQVEDRTISG